MTKVHLDIDKQVFDRLQAKKDEYEEILHIGITWDEFFENFIVFVSDKTVQTSLNRLKSDEPL